MADKFLTVYSRIAPALFDSTQTDTRYVIADGVWYAVPKHITLSHVEWIKNELISEKPKFILNESN